MKTRSIKVNTYSLPPSLSLSLSLSLSPLFLTSLLLSFFLLLYHTLSLFHLCSHHSHFISFLNFLFTLLYFFSFPFFVPFSHPPRPSLALIYSPPLLSMTLSPSLPSSNVPYFLIQFPVTLLSLSQLLSFHFLIYRLNK